MSKIFYDHLTEIKDLLILLDKYDLDAVQKKEFINLIDETMHHHVIDIILEKLDIEKHELFLTHFHQNPNDSMLLEFLKIEVGPEMEKHIKNEADKIKKTILKEIKDCCLARD